MKARTKAQREVMALSATLPSLKGKDIEDARKAYAGIYYGAKEAWCDVCGHVWQSDLWKNPKEMAVCPHCGARGKAIKGAGKTMSENKYYATCVRRCGEWQVLRTMFCHRITRKGGEKKFWYKNEVFQRWMKPDTKDVVIGYGVYGCCYYYDQWNTTGRWEIRTDHARYEAVGEVCGRSYLTAIVKRNGLKALRKEMNARWLLWLMIHEPKAEILAKGRQWEMLKYLTYARHEDVSEKWPIVRVAMRHGYIIKDASIWCDMVDALARCGKDCHNPKYVCPENLMKAHDDAMLMDVRREDREAMKEADNKERIWAKKIIDNKLIAESYYKRVGKWLGIVIKVGDIEIRPLQSVKAFYEEGEVMHHCVFRNEYYKKENRLILSARKDGVRMETIELDTKNWSILQCRGRHNQPSAFHDRIMTIMNDNIKKIRYADNTN